MPKYDDLDKRSVHICDVEYRSFLSQSKIEFEEEYGKPGNSTYMIGDFDIIRTIGIGSFGHVVLVKSKESGSFHAVKICSKDQLVASSSTEYIMRERHILRAIAFPFIITLQTTFQDSSYLYLVMPFMDGGDLFNLLKKKKNLPESDAIFYVAQLVLCVEYLEYLGIVYRDLKPENVLLDSLGYIKLTDFGFSRRLSGRTYTFCGTLEYMAPEIVAGKGYTKGVDWWSLGTLTYELIAGRTPFRASDPEKLFRIYEKLKKTGFLNIPAHFSLPLRSFVAALMEHNPLRRLGCLQGGAKEVKSHPWMKEVNWAGILERVEQPPYVPVTKGPGDASHFEVYEDAKFIFSDVDKYARHFQDF